MEKLQPITPEFAYERLRKVPNTTLSIQNRPDPQTAFAQTTVTRGNFIALCTAGLLEAKHLLAQDLKIKEVARRLHFTQASHFSVWFTRLTKKTPYAWGHGYNYHSGE